MVKREIALLDENYQKWMDLVENNASLRELIQKTNIKRYMTNDIKQIDGLHMD